MTYPNPFKRVYDCAQGVVARLGPPEHRDWIAFLHRDWAEIVGSSLAQQTVPGQMWFKNPSDATDGVLTVYASSPGAAMVLHHETMGMRDAVNTYYQQSLVCRVRVQVR